MKLIEAEKVERAIKDYWKAQVNRAPIPKSTKEYNAYVNCLDAILEHNDGLLKAIDELPSAEPDTTTHDSIPAETDKNDGDRTSGDCISRTQAIDTIKEIYEWHDSVTKERIIEHFKQLPSAQPERKTGHWVKSDMQRWYDVWLCSECGEKTDSAVMSKPRYKYCPMCGAKMEEGREDG